MADEGAWNQGWALGAGLAQEQRARKQALTDEERETHLGELGQNISSLQKKYSSLLGPKGEDTPESLKTKYALNQAMQQRDALLGPQKTPSVGGKIGEKIGEALHLAKKPEAQTVTTQPAALPATPSAPITSPELPAYKRGATAPTEPGVAATTLPAMEGGGAPALPAGKPTTVQGPALTPGQKKAQAQANQRALQETNELVAAAPLTAQQQMIQQAQASTAGKIESIRGGLETIKTFHPEATPEQLEQMNNTYLDTVLGTREKSTMKPLTSAKPYKGTDGRYYLSMQDPLTGAITAEPMPEGYQPPPEKPGTSKFAMNVDSYKAMHNISPGQKLTPQELNFVEQQIALSSAAPSTSITNTLKQNFQGFWVPIQESNRRIPGFGYILSDPHGAAAAPTGGAAAGGGAGAAGAPAATPGAVRKKAQTRAQAQGAGAPAAQAGGIKVGAPLFAAPSKEYTETKSEYDAAVTRMKTMDKNLVNALKGDQQAMLSLVANHIGMTFGAQKGAHITQSVWNEAVKTAPWPSKLGARFDSRGLLSGVTLAPDQMRQMVNLAHERVEVLKDAVSTLTQQLTAPPGTAPKAGGQSLADRLRNALRGK